MRDEKKNRGVIKIVVFITSVFVILLSVSYAFINLTLEGTRRQVITTGNLSLTLNEEENALVIDDAVPMYDEVGMLGDAFTFTLSNNTTIATDYTIRLDDITTGEKLDTNIVKYGLTKNRVNNIDLLSNLNDGTIDSGTITTIPIEYELRFWIDSSVTENSQIQSKTLSYRIVVEAGQASIYQEYVLNGADPILSDNLVPVMLASDGTVTKADINAEWYNYENLEWANAVVLVDDSVEYNNGDVIPEENIESYFVWIPRYRYKIFNEGNYDSLTSITNATQIIEVEFETKDDEISTGTTIGEWLTHPAFVAFNTNGLWVGKFESGYNGAISNTGAEVNSADSSKLIIKPNVYSWRGITVGNAFQVAYNYLRENDSHMMKNTEWGAVAYLQHSAYGSQASVRINNNYSYITGYAATEEPTLGYNAGTSIAGNRIEGTVLNSDGIYTKRYNTSIGYLASTTKNITGVYDMSGGAHEYVMGYNTQATIVGGESGITEFNDINTRYYDKYSSSNMDGYEPIYTGRLLGDATGEMGPFGSQLDLDGGTRYILGWYSDYGLFLTISNPWFGRGGGWDVGSESGIFAFHYFTGKNDARISFRTVLAP